MPPKRKKPPAKSPDAKSEGGLGGGPTVWQSKIVGHDRVDPEQLLANPLNYRKHPQAQREALRAAINEIGFIRSVTVNKRTGNLLDGHERVWQAMAAEQPWIDVEYVDLSEEEERAALATMDPLGEMAKIDRALLDQLLEDVTVGAEPLQNMLDELVGKASLPFTVTTVPVGELKFHLRNYRQHPDDQLDHLIQSIRDHGFYRNVVVARDNTVLAGQGVVQAALKMGMERVPVIRLNLAPDDPRALKVLVADNEISNLAEVDDRVLTNMLKELIGLDVSLLGTGFDPEQLSALLMVTRPTSEIADKSAAEEWIGLPTFESASAPIQMVVSFASPEDRADFITRLGLVATEKTKSVWWPQKDRDDLKSVKFEAD